jgi:hypothetical protein
VQRTLSGSKQKLLRRNQLRSNGSLQSNEIQFNSS